MNVSKKDLIEALAIICENRNLKAAVTESVKGGVVTGASAILGGLILGPIGLALGGVIGGTVSAISSHNKFRPVAAVIRDMPREKKLLLCNKIKKAFEHVGVEDLAALAMMIMSQSALKEIAIREVTQFLSSNMNMNVIQ